MQKCEDCFTCTRKTCHNPEKYHDWFLTLCSSNENGNTHLCKCPHCKGENLEEINHSYIGYTVCEYDYYCKDCKKIVGHWSYGHPEP
jgi:hypothetical protein